MALKSKLVGCLTLDYKLLTLPRYSEYITVCCCFYVLLVFFFFSRFSCSRSRFASRRFSSFADFNYSCERLTILFVFMSLHVPSCHPPQSSAGFSQTCCGATAGGAGNVVNTGGCATLSTADAISSSTHSSNSSAGRTTTTTLREFHQTTVREFAALGNNDRFDKLAVARNGVDRVFWHCVTSSQDVRCTDQGVRGLGCVHL
jgi:hypothetical protein